jgi:MYXO-CTERM domain-containing protein
MSFPFKVTAPSSTAVSAFAAWLAIGGVSACAPQDPGVSTESVTRAATATPNKVDILFMVDNSSSMTSMQQKMLAQIPTFIQVLQALPAGLPDIHLAVVSSDLGAPSDQGPGIGCSQNGGDDGNFFFAPRGTCTATTLVPNATFIMDDATGATKNFTLADPVGLATVFQCIALLGQSGCGFEHQLASVARSLGADGQPPPAANVGFLRDDAELAIVMLTNEDDCSAPASASPLAIYSLNGGMQNIANPEGPIANYRCNGGPLGGHLCVDPSGPTPTALQQPPLDPPADATTGDPRTLTLTSCESNDTSSSGLIPVGSLIAGIKALKANTSSDIVVGAIVAPATPYVVQWLPAPGPSTAELWPSVEHSCGPTADQSFGDPSVRISQFVQAFGDSGVIGSICDGSFQPTFQLIANKIGAHLAGGGAGTGGQSGQGGTAGPAGQGGQGGGGQGGQGGGGQGGQGGSVGSGGSVGTGNGATGGTTTTGAGGTGGASGAGGHGGAPRDGGSADTGETLGKGGGCDCQTGGGSRRAWGPMLLVGLLFSRRSRRPRRPR